MAKRYLLFPLPKYQISLIYTALIIKTTLAMQHIRLISFFFLIQGKQPLLPLQLNNLVYQVTACPKTHLSTK